MLNIICVDDQQEVLDSIIRDLRPLANDSVRLEEASDEQDCLALIDELHQDGEDIAIILTDRVMPNGSGLEMLAAIASDSRFNKTRKVILTGLPEDAESQTAQAAGHFDTYLEKPWSAEELQQEILRQLALYRDSVQA